jgi:large subunit ribosomal protein L19
MDLMRAVEADQTKENIENFRIGDTVKVHFKIIEGRTERVQIFEGIVLAKKRDGLRRTFTVRKISYGVGVERTFPLNSPKIQKIVRVREGRIRRAKLYYIRGRYGKAAKVAELIRKRRDVKVPETGAPQDEAAGGSAQGST